MTHYYQVIMWISSDLNIEDAEDRKCLGDDIKKAMTVAILKQRYHERIEQIDVYEEKELPERKA